MFSNVSSTMKRPFSFQPYCGVCPVSTAQHLGASGYSSWYYKYIYIYMHVYLCIWKDLTDFFSRSKVLIAIFPNCQSRVDLLCILVCRQHVCALLFLEFFYLAAHLLMAHPSAFATALPIVSLRIAVRQRRSGSAILGQRDKKGHDRKQVEMEDCQNTHKYKCPKFVVAFQWVYISHLLAGIYPTKYQYHI